MVSGSAGSSDGTIQDPEGVIGGSPTDAAGSDGASASVTDMPGSQGDRPWQSMQGEAEGAGRGNVDGAGTAKGGELGTDIGNGDAAAPALGGSGSAGSLTTWFGSSFDPGLVALGLGGPGHLPTVPAVIGSTVAVTTWMSFMLFNKRRRDGEPVAPDSVLRAAAATGVGVAIAPVPSFDGTVDPEALMPRWRRPSLLEARKLDPVRSPGAERPRLAFADDYGSEATGGERRAVRYTVATLLDRPDEIQASRLGELVAGDEVQVLGRSGAYCNVLCPDGRAGWVHRMTLGDVTSTLYGTSRAASNEIEPEAENALAALLAARGIS